MKQQRSLPSVALVGRMNVGKSTLFNRLSSDVKALTLDFEGVTRDIVHDTVSWQDTTFELIDTGGLTFDKKTHKDKTEVEKSIEYGVAKAATQAIDDAAVVVLVIDGTVGITQLDRRISDMLHEKKKKVIVAVNKADRSEAHESYHEASGLGHMSYMLISAQHGIGIGELLEAIVTALPKTAISTAVEPDFKVLILGRPNVGKSSLMNALLEHERSIVADVPGTTREPITESIMFYKQAIALTDTPGIRRRKAIEGDLETMMTKSAFDALRQSHIVLLIVDGQEGELVNQDLKLAFYAFERQAKALIILINKVDAITDEQKIFLKNSLDSYEHLIRKIPVLQISAKTGKNIGKILPLIETIWKRSHTEIDTHALHELIISKTHRRPMVATGKHIQVQNIRQIKTAPITLSLKVNYPALMSESHKTFIENLVRETTDLIGVPIRIIIEGAT